ncbi:MAG TPA: DNA repair protein RecN [Thermosynechococcaceae cyanobacterium]
MLTALRIENFALVDRLELGLSAGLTALTGETGAGKSIILDAIDAVLGGKVTSRAVRTGAERAMIEATFGIDLELETWLKAQEIELLEEGAIICSREIVASQGSRNRSRINGVLVNKQQMEFVRDRLVKLTAQGQTVQIGQPPLQRAWLDSYGGEKLVKQRETVATVFAAYQQAQQALEKRRKSEKERLQQLDLFDYQLRELRAAHLNDPDELEQLEQERNRLTHSVELQQQSYQVYQALYQNDGGAEACADLLGKAEVLLQDMVEYDNQIQPVLELVNNALAQVEQASREINFYGESIEADPQRLQEVQERIVELKQVCRKYGPDLSDAIALLQRLQAEMEELTGGGQSLEALEQAAQERQATLIQECATLTQLRQVTARELEERLIAELKPLAMEKVQFQVSITPYPLSANGADLVTFVFSPNPGEPLQPLTEIASGGEMSRFLLALQASFSQIDAVGTLVFDEIDVGVSGRVTQAIAEKLHHLSQHHQVLCVTHQPIVAAMADQHLRVSKHTIELAAANGNGHVLNDKNSNGKNGKKRRTKAEGDTVSPAETEIPAAHTSSEVRTVVRVAPLDADQRREELAQLAGGQTAQEAIAFADSLLAQAATLRQSRSSSISKTVSEPKSRPKASAASGKTKTARKA